MQSYAGKSGRQIFDDIPDDVADDMADDIEGLIDYKLKSYVQVSGYSGPIPGDIKTVILDKVSGATRRKWLRELQTNASMLQADASKLQDNASKSAQNSDMLNEPAVIGILNLGQNMSALNITISGQVISIGVDDLDSTYKKLKIYGAKMRHQNNIKSLVISDKGVFIYIGSRKDGIINYIQINGLLALNLCQIDGYYCGDTLSDFIARHGKPGNSYEDENNDNLYYTYYCDDTCMSQMDISASDKNTIDSIKIFASI